MKRAITRILLGIFIAIGLFVGLVVIPYFGNIVMAWDRAEAIETAITWGGLAEIPEPANITSVGTRGNMFTRGFMVEFELEPNEIDEWIKNSKRLKDANYNQEEGVITYKIYPGEERAFGGTVTINKKERKVFINMSWS